MDGGFNVHGTSDVLIYGVVSDAGYIADVGNMSSQSETLKVCTGKASIEWRNLLFLPG
jgi:hypothetical protein